MALGTPYVTDLAPQLAQPGLPRKTIGLHRLDRVEDIGCGHRHSVVPVQAGTQAKVVDQAILADRHTVGEIRNDVAPFVQAREAVEK